MAEFFDKNIETLPRKELKALQLERFKRQARFVYDNVPAYKRKFDAAGVKPSHIRTWGDVKSIPFTTKDDFRDNYPYGLFAAPMDKIARIHASSGTTGKATVVGYTARDLDCWSDCVARFLVSSGASPRDVFQIAFGYGLFTGAFGLHAGCEKIGAAVIPISSGNTERQVKMMIDLKSTALVSTPSYALYIAETLYQSGRGKEDISLRLGFFGAEASTPEMHAILAGRLGIRTNDNYGLSEVMGPGVSGECAEKMGMHIAEDHILAEIVDPDTLEPLPDGERGELVLTTLTKEGIPVLRYRTKDITRLHCEPCPCGRTHARMEKVTGRTDDMLIIRGVNVFPSQIESVLVNMPEVGAHYEITVGRENLTDRLSVKVEVSDGNLLLDFRRLEDLKKRVRGKLRSELQLDVDVKLVEPLSLKRFEGKAQRVIDKREEGKR
ncbi:MAG: phenylacetate--CoA ligase [Clostridiales bacterium]|jgi:phenylacetate-CoA ligase|nr:phenylacetate--CoA ligase [Clostridiales bacterium]